jgi:beta-lactamase regulating signal transducer with metallopeptidase domain
MNFFYSFTLTIIHSLWQAAILLLFYFIINAASNKIHPLKKRNFLYSLTVVQLLASFFTFYLYASDSNLINFTYLLNDVSWINKYGSIIFVTYSLFVAIKLLAVLFQWQHFKNGYTNGLIKPNVEIKLFTDLKSLQLGITKKVKVWYSNQIKVPITFGFLKPIILLPFGLVNDLSIQEIEAIVLHELTHIKNKDYFYNWMLVIIEIIYFYNPFIKILIEKLKIEREKNCDIQVIHFNYDVVHYAQVLLKIAKYGNSVKSFQMSAVKSTTQLFKRIHFFSDTEKVTFKNSNIGFYNLLLLPILIFTTIYFSQKKNELQTVNLASKATAKLIDVINAGYANVNSNNEFYASAIVAIEQENEYTINQNSNIESETVIGQQPEEIDTLMLSSEYYNELPQSIYYTPVGFDETNMQDSIKVIEYNLETAEGKMKQVYKLIKHKGVWKMYPQWMITEVNGRFDSLNYNKVLDSTFKGLEVQ